MFVTGVDTPLTSLELAFIKDIENYVDKIFWVINKIDLVADNERDDVLNFVTGIIQTKTGCGGLVKVFPVSARNGLSAKLAGDPVLAEQSGLPVLEAALAAFLVEEKSAAFLAVIAHKILVIAKEIGKGILSEPSSPATSESICQSATVRLDSAVAIAAIMAVRTKLEAMYRGCRPEKGSKDVDTELPAIKTRQSERIRRPAVIIPTLAAADMAADLQIPDCPVCRHIAKCSDKFLEYWQYRLSSDERTQNEFAVERGFCPLHTWQLLAISSPHGASVGYAQLAEQLAQQLTKYLAVPAEGEAVRRLVRDSQNCRVCNLIRQAETDYIHKLAGMIDHTDGRKQYRYSPGVCLRHLGMLMDNVATTEDRKFLLGHAARCFAEDAEDMQSYAMKYEAVRRALHNRNEEDAYRRAIIRLVGDRSVCLP